MRLQENNQLQDGNGDYVTSRDVTSCHFLHYEDAMSQLLFTASYDSLYSSLVSSLANESESENPSPRKAFAGGPAFTAFITNDSVKAQQANHFSPEGFMIQQSTQTGSTQLARFP